jgi:hypothetical protein
MLKNYIAGSTFNEYWCKYKDLDNIVNQLKIKKNHKKCYVKKIGDDININGKYEKYPKRFFVIGIERKKKEYHIILNHYIQKTMEVIK